MDEKKKTIEVNEKVNSISIPALSVAHKSYRDAVIYKGDTGASRHYFRDNDKQALVNLKQCTHTTSVHLPDNSMIESNEVGNLPIPELSAAATTTAIFPALTNSSLISIGQLCDDECTALLNKKEMKIIKNNKVIIQGKLECVDFITCYEIQTS